MKRTYYMGDQALPQIAFTASERTTLRRAALILAKTRELREDDDDDFTTDIALAMHTCEELSRDAEIPA